MNLKAKSQEFDHQEYTPSRYNNVMPFLSVKELLEEEKISTLFSEKKDESDANERSFIEDSSIPLWDTPSYKVTSLTQQMKKRNKMLVDKGDISERTKDSDSLKTSRPNREQQKKDLSFLRLKPKGSPDFARRIKYLEIDGLKQKNKGRLRLPSALFQGEFDSCSDCSMEEIQIFERSHENNSEEARGIEESFYTPNLSLHSNAPNFTDVCNFREHGC